MYNNVYISPIARGLIRGHREMISGIEFVATDDSVAARDVAYQSARNHSLAIMRAQDTTIVDGVEVHTPRELSLEARRNLYASQQQ